MSTRKCGSCEIPLRNAKPGVARRPELTAGVSPPSARCHDCSSAIRRCARAAATAVVTTAALEGAEVAIDRSIVGRQPRFLSGPRDGRSSSPICPSPPTKRLARRSGGQPDACLKNVTGSARAPSSIEATNVGFTARHRDTPPVGMCPQLSRTDPRAAALPLSAGSGPAPPPPGRGRSPGGARHRGARHDAALLDTRSTSRPSRCCIR